MHHFWVKPEHYFWVDIVFRAERVHEMTYTENEVTHKKSLRWHRAFDFIQVRLTRIPIKNYSPSLPLGHIACLQRFVYHSHSY